VKAAPGLEAWKMNNLLLSALTLPHVDGETLEEYAKRVKADAEEQGKKAREKGTIIHGQLERFYLGESIDQEYAGICSDVDMLLSGRYGITRLNVEAEKSFATDYGYGGKVDLVCRDKNIVVDFKTTEFTLDGKGNTMKKGKKEKLHWPDHVVQLAAYREGVMMHTANVLNVFVSTLDGSVHVHEWDDEDVCNGMTEFLLLHNLWRHTKKYDPVMGE